MTLVTRITCVQLHIFCCTHRVDCVRPGNGPAYAWPLENLRPYPQAAHRFAAVSHKPSTGSCTEKSGLVSRRPSNGQTTPQHCAIVRAAHPDARATPHGGNWRAGGAWLSQLGSPGAGGQARQHVRPITPGASSRASSARLPCSRHSLAARGGHHQGRPRPAPPPAHVTAWARRSQRHGPALTSLATAPKEATTSRAVSPPIFTRCRRRVSDARAVTNPGRGALSEYCRLLSGGDGALSMGLAHMSGEVPRVQGDCGSSDGQSAPRARGGQRHAQAPGCRARSRTSARGGGLRGRGRGRAGARGCRGLPGVRVRGTQGQHRPGGHRAVRERRGRFRRACRADRHCR